MIDYIQFIMIHGLNIPGSYAKLFFTAWDFTFTTRCIHNWASFPLLSSHKVTLISRFCQSSWLQCFQRSISGGLALVLSGESRSCSWRQRRPAEQETTSCYWSKGRHTSQYLVLLKQMTQPMPSGKNIDPLALPSEKSHWTSQITFND